jgi:hypothetical protein
MARPRKAEARDHQVNLRFTAPELVKIHAHAALTGKTVTEFGRAVLLRRPRRRRNGVAPVLLVINEAGVHRWQTLGDRLNAIAHMMNARDDLPPQKLLPLLANLRELLRHSFPALFVADALPEAYALAPAGRHHLRKVGVNLAQIRTRFDQLGLETPIGLIRLLQRVRAIMNGDQPPHGA